MADKMKINSSELHKHHRERMRHQYEISGQGALNDHQILEILLYFAIPREDTNPMAHMLLNRFGTLAGVFEADEKSLMEIPGIGENAAFLLRYMPEIAERYLISKQHPERRPRFADTKSLREYIELCFLREHACEKMMLLGLNSLHELIHQQYSSQGGENLIFDEMSAHLRSMCSSGCTDIVVAHFHPNGELRPSAEDNRVTAAVGNACSGIGMRLCDHIIVTDSGSVSCFENAGNPGFAASADMMFHPMFGENQSHCN